MKYLRNSCTRFRNPCFLIFASIWLLAAQVQAQATTFIANDVAEVDPTDGVSSIVDVLANDSNTEGLPPLITSVTGACTGGTLAQSQQAEEDGLYLVFTPNANFDSPCVFHYSAGTELGDSGSAQVTLLPGTVSDPSGQLPSANLLSNPGFEDGLGGWLPEVRSELAGHTGFVRGGSGISAPHTGGGAGVSLAAYSIHNLSSGWLQRSDQINTAVGTDWILVFDVAWTFGKPTHGGWRASVIRKQDDHLDDPPSLVDIEWRDGVVSCSSAACSQSSGGSISPGFTRFEFPFVDSGDQSLNVRFEIIEASGHVVFDNVRMLKNPTENNPNDKLASRNGDFESGWSYWESHARPGFPNTSITPTGIQPSSGQTTFVLSNISGGYVESTALPVIAGNSYSLVPRRRGAAIANCSLGGPHESFTAWVVSLAFQDLSGQVISTQQISTGAPCDPLTGAFSDSPAAHNQTLVAPVGAVAARVRLHQHMSSGWIEYDFGGGAMELVDQSTGIRRSLPTSSADWTLAREDGFGGQYVGPGAYSDSSGIWHLSNRAEGHLKSDLVRISDDGTYRLSGWERGVAKGTINGNSMIETRLYAEDGTTLLATRVAYDEKVPSENWTQHSLDFDVPTGATWAEVRLRNDASHGWITFDDLELIQLTGTPPPTGPVIDDKTYTVNEDSSANVLDLLAGQAADLDLIAISQPVAGGVATIVNGSRSVSYTPAADFSGQDSFSFTAVDTEGRFTSATATVSVLAVNDPPSASLQVTCTDHGSTATCQANMSGSTDPEKDPLTFSYKFDGQWTTNPEHTFETGGPKTVWGRVLDSSGADDLASSYVQLDLDPIPSVQVSCNGANCTIDISGSSDDVALTWYEVNCGDGQSRFGVYSPLEATFEHVYAESGDYPVGLTVWDSSTASASAGATAVVDLLPVAAFELDRRLLSVSFDASASTDDRGIADLSWDFGDGQVGSGSNPTHVYADDGTYTVLLTVTDTAGQVGSTSRQVRVLSAGTIAGLIPVLSASKVDPAPTALPSASCTDLDCTLDPNGSSDDRGILRMLVDWGDGSESVEQDWSAESGSNLLPHVYAAPGTYTVKLTVLDASNGSDTATTLVTVTASQAIHTEASSEETGGAS